MYNYYSKLSCNVSPPSIDFRSCISSISSSSNASSSSSIETLFNKRCVTPGVFQNNYLTLGTVKIIFLPNYL